MAKQNNGINGGYKGSVGTVVGYSWRGQWCTRARPCMVKNPHSAAQEESRNWFTAAVRLASSMRPALRQGLHYSSMAQHMTEGNYFIRINRQHLAWQEGALAVDYGSLVVAEGAVTPVHFGEATGPVGGEWTVPFTTHPEDGRTSKHDTVYLYAYCPEQKQGVMAPPVYRYAERVTLVTPRHWGDSRIWLYGWVQDIDGHCSDSVSISM